METKKKVANGEVHLDNGVSSEDFSAAADFLNLSAQTQLEESLRHAKEEVETATVCIEQHDLSGGVEHYVFAAKFYKQANMEKESKECQSKIERLKSEVEGIDALVSDPAASVQVPEADQDHVQTSGVT
eukprot:CAMPEP_0184321032 /NCGR_PEP_ID=MMETSP1049-20130417/117040_1 /TAXON_ID=77928 /ORGANISM="Proteomonas sulcata, Strain CCMP704" /LENGTH=128 /DNA_ID=CAMNT_0026641713 /DNA_START=30 /DNA_END=413 /DNA_ORIENTATION=+